MLSSYLSFLALACAALALPSNSPFGGSGAPTAKTKNGTYMGVDNAQYNQVFFLGVPYAQPPVGDLRFRVPQSLNSSWSDSPSAAAYSAACVGYGSDQWNYPTSEV